MNSQHENALRLTNTGGVTIEQFDEDHEPIGPSLREDMRRDGLIGEFEGAIFRTDDGVRCPHRLCANDEPPNFVVCDESGKNVTYDWRKVESIVEGDMVDIGGVWDVVVSVVSDSGFVWMSTNKGPILKARGDLVLTVQHAK